MHNIGSGGTILTSTDGIMWKRRVTPVTAWLTGVTYGNGMFVATGFVAGNGMALEGTILQSAPVSVPSLTADRDVSGGGIALTLAGEIGRGYRIQVSTNMASTNWEDFLTFTSTVPTTEFLDTSVTNVPQRFYRAVSP